MRIKVASCTFTRFGMVASFLVLLMGSSKPMTGQPLTVMTYNIRFATRTDGPDAWSKRKGELAKLVAGRAPDFLCVQEALYGQLLFLDKKLKTHRRIGTGRDDGLQGGEHTAIYYAAPRFELERTNTFWLSDTPDMPSTGWDAALPRICTYGVFRERSSGRHMVVLNTHFDHVGFRAREMAARQILDTIAALANHYDYIVLAGDFNSPPDSRPVALFLTSLQDGSMLAPGGVEGPAGTYQAFEIDTPVVHRIDYVFVQKLTVTSYQHLDHRRKNGRWPSDHLPVWVKLNWPAP